MHRFFLLLCLISFGLSAQTLERSFGLELTPHYASSRITGGSNVTFSELERLDSLESGAYGYGAGLVYESRVERIGFTTGLRYTRTGLDRLRQPLDAGSQSFTETVSAHYLAVPFDVNFYQDISEANRVLFSLGAGLQYHLSTQTRRTIYDGDREVETREVDNSTTEFRPLLVSFSTAIGYDRKLSPDYAIRFQPYFQFFLQGNLRENADIRANRNYYQVGLRLVVRRLFI
ncbi:outer membrane beta-barrel protein [Lewinella sp. IMCC34191]|uniref:outer membrane beta-barrel protein n=1 Tax=Lewinella sp. IMCC34191 TaxID=2259172 RepID=UPI000E23518A|nr:outer membrane beta-barrel protein [Lewinella sp. IMCC34191]